jgi:hypothetical protein
LESLVLGLLLLELVLNSGVNSLLYAFAVAVVFANKQGLDVLPLFHAHHLKDLARLLLHCRLDVVGKPDTALNLVEELAHLRICAFVVLVAS